MLTYTKKKLIYTKIKVFKKLSDDTWTAAYDSAFQYLKLFAADKPVP